MNAMTEGGKVYVHILELHKGITDENVRDNIPEIKIATTAGTSGINWAWILGKGYMPIVKASPTILKSTLSHYLFTPEFWICDCEFNWLRTRQFVCPECSTNVLGYMKSPSKMPLTENLWGKGPFPSIEQTLLEGMVKVAEAKIEMPDTIKTLYQHMKFHSFDWVKAYNIENF
jgi:hypothetical protein